MEGLRLQAECPSARDLDSDCRIPNVTRHLPALRLMHLQATCLICKEWEPGGMGSRRKKKRCLPPLSTLPVPRKVVAMAGCPHLLCGLCLRTLERAREAVLHCRMFLTVLGVQPAFVKVLDESQVNGYLYLIGGEIKRLDDCTSTWSLWNPCGGLCALSAKGDGQSLRSSHPTQRP